MMLSLDHNKLSGTLAPAMSSWTTLSALALNDNHFTGSISRAAGAVSPLIGVLRFDHNNFTSIDADVCSAWRRLNLCNIRNNSFDCCLACLEQWGSPCRGQCQGKGCSAPLVPTSKPTSSSDALHKKWWLVLLLTFITAAAFATLASLLTLGAYVWWKRRAKRRLRDEMGGRVTLRSIIEGGSLETALLAEHDDAAAAAAAAAFEKEADSYAAWCSPAVAQQRLTVVEELKSRRAAYDTSSMVRIGLLNSRSISDTKPTVFYDQRRVGLLGRGRFGTVCLGAVQWPRQLSIGVCGSSESQRGHELVAVKTTMVTEGSVGSVMERNAAAEAGSPRITTTNEGNLLWAAHGHPNIVGLIGVVDGGVVAEHLVLELCPVSLSERALSLHAPELRRLIGIDIRLQCHLSAGLLHGLSHLHSLRICHRDVKPSNALIHVGPPTRANGMTGLTIKLGDFGLAKIGASDETMHRGASEFDVSMTLTPFCGTVGWRAPEQYRTDSLACQPHTTSVVSTTIEEQQLSDAYAAGMVIFYFFFGTKRRMHAPLMVDHTASSSGSSSSSSSAEGTSSSVAGAEVEAGVAATSDVELLRQHQRGQRLHVDQMFQLFHGRCDRLQSREVNDLVHTMLASRKDAVASHFAAARGSTLPPTVARELAVWSAVVDGLTNRTPAMRMAILDAAKLVDCYDSEDGGVQYRNGDAAAAYNDAEVHTLFLCIGDVHPSSRSLAYICAAHYSAQHSRVVEVSELEHPPDEGDLAAKLTSLFVMRFAGLRTLHVVRSSVDEATRAATDSALREALDSMAVPIALLISVGERGCGSAAARAMLHSAEAVVGWEGARENGGESDVSLLFSSAMHDELAKERGQYDPEQAVETARITVKSVSEFRGLYDGQTAAFEIKYAMVSPNASCVDVATGRVDATAGRGIMPGALPVGEPFYLTKQARGKGKEREE